MADDDGVKGVKKNIADIYRRKKAAALAVCIYYAGLGVQYVRQAQAANTYWTNRTGVAKDTVFGGPISTDREIGWFIAHQVEYGVYLELANDRRNAVLFPTVVRYYGRFIKDLEKVYGEAA